MLDGMLNVHGQYFITLHWQRDRDKSNLSAVWDGLSVDCDKLVYTSRGQQIKSSSHSSPYLRHRTACVGKQERNLNSLKR